MSHHTFTVKEQRFARRVEHQCCTCRRWFDGEDYTRVFHVEPGTVTALRFCRECQPLRGYAA